MSIVAATTRVVTKTAVGSQFITTPGLGNLTPLAAWFVVTRAVTDGTAADHAVLGKGAATAVGEQWALCVSSENGVTPSDAYRRGVTDECVLILNPGTGVIDGEANFVQFINNGVEINWGDAPAAAYLLTVRFFAGTGLSAHANVFTLAAAQNATVDINTVGFEPNALLTAGHGWPFNDATRDNTFLSYGVVINETPVTQLSIGSTFSDAVNPADSGAQIRNDYGICWVSGLTGNALLAGEFGAFDAQGFSCTTRLAGAADSEAVGYLALAFNDEVDFWAGIINTPVATGDDSQVGPGIEPQFVTCGLTQLTAVNTATSSADSGSVGVNSFDTNDEYCDSIQDEFGVAPTDTQSVSDDQVVHLDADDGTQSFEATFVSFDTLGWTWNFSATEGTARLWWAFALGAEAAVAVTAVETTIPTMMQQKGLSILVYKPTIASITPAGTFLMNLESEIDTYTQVIQAMGGYWSARFTIRDRLDVAEDWIDDGLGRHIETYNPGLVRIWEGFVNKVTLNVGGFQVVRGPLTDIGNRVRLVYSAVDTSVIPPAVGTRVTEGPQNNADSQALYGIVEKVLTAGGIPAGNADDILTTYITEFNLPETSKSLSTERQSEPVVTVECLGYVHWLQLYTYTQTTNTGTQNLSTKIEDVLDADPNSLFASTNADITANTLAVAQFENNDRTAWALIKSLVAKGDAAGDRYLFGVYNDRRVEYDVIPTTIEYQQHLTSPAQKITTLSGVEIKPWNVRAGRWLFLPDFLIGKTQPANLREDPRALFIESATYAAPWSLSLDGGKVSTLSQKLARLGLSGIGTG